MTSQKHGRRLIGWDEILEGGPGGHGDVLAGFKGAVQAAGYDTVSTPTEWAYSNHYQSEEAEGEPLATGGLTPLE